MTSITRALSSKRTGLLPALILSVSLTGCSTYLDGVVSSLAADAELAGRQEVVATKAVAEAKPEPPAAIPEMPTFVKACVRFGAAEARQRAQAKNSKTASADELTLGVLKTDDERRKCTKAVMDYYRSVQEANKKAGNKKGLSTGGKVAKAGTS